MKKASCLSWEEIWPVGHALPFLALGGVTGGRAERTCRMGDPSLTRKPRVAFSFAPETCGFDVFSLKRGNVTLTGKIFTDVTS